jgi:amino acid adenylation domain-containing protein
VVHHIASDGWSVEILLRELTAFYRGSGAALPELPVQFGDLAVWEREGSGAAVLDREVAYWRGALAGLPQDVELPTDRPRRADRDLAGAVARLEVPNATYQPLAALGRRLGASPFMVLLAAWQVVFARLAGERDVAVGTPVAGRGRSEVEHLMGIFLNTLVLRTDLAGDPTFEALVERVRGAALAAYAHQQLPFERLLQEVEVERDRSRTPLFSVFFNLFTPTGEPPDLDDHLTVRSRKSLEEPSKFDLTLYVTPPKDDRRDRPLRVRAVYDRHLFDASSIERFLAQYARVLEQVAVDSRCRIEELSLVTAEMTRVLPDPSERLDASFRGAIHDLFARRAAESPERPAISDRSLAWTYGELDEVSLALAHALARTGTGRGSRVAVWAHRGAPLAAAVLGTLRSGATLVMLDPAYPPARLVAMLEAATPSALVELEAAGEPPAAVVETLENLGSARLALSPQGLLRAPGMSDGPEHASEHPALPEVGPDDIATLAFTSGSTGEPKGVLGRHGPLTHFLPWQCERLDLRPCDRFSLLSGLAHDPLQRDLFTPWFLGASIAVPDPELISAAGALASWMDDEGVSVAHLTPAMGQVLSEVDPLRGPVELPRLRRALVVGDALTRRDVARLEALAPNVTVVNLYGATESQRAVSYHVVEPGTSGSLADDGVTGRQVVPLGVGMEGVQLLVLDGAGQQAAVGEVGEVALRSPHLAAGYLDDPERTAERFLADPAGAPVRRYLTGDLGRVLADGTVAFVGRADSQVKIRGFRVEPAEIEAVLEGEPSVREAVVVARDDLGGGRRLVGYLVAEAGWRPDPAALRRRLRQRLPAYMVPADLVPLAKIPLTPNGKVDRRALPAPARRESSTARPAGSWTALERRIAALWAEVLELDEVDGQESFFELGGHSLLLVRYHARLQEELDRAIPLAALFTHATVRAQARWLAETAPAPGDGRPPRIEPTTEPPVLSPGQERLWVLQRLAPESPALNIAHALELDGPLDLAALARAVAWVVARHEPLRSRFPAVDGLPTVVVEPADPIDSMAPWPLPVLDVTGLGEGARAVARRLRADEASRPFDLAVGPVLRTTVVRLGKLEHLLLVSTHHIASDGWSVVLFSREIATAYRAFVDGERPDLPALELAYRDVAAWQRRWLEGDGPTQQLAVWSQRLTPLPAPLELPTDRPRTADEGRRRGAWRPFRIPLERADRLREVAAATGGGATLYTLLLALFGVWLGRLAGREDFTVGSPVAGRSERRTEELIGLFINTLVLRLDLAGAGTLGELIERVRAVSAEALAHQELPFERLVDELRPERSLVHTPLFQALLVLQNQPVEGMSADDGELVLRPVAETPDLEAQFEISLSLVDRGIGTPLAGELQYRADLFDATTVERWCRGFERLLAVADPAASLAALPVLSRAEHHQVTVETVGPELAPDCVEASLWTLVERSAARRPDGRAVVSREASWTYRQLLARVEALAGRLSAVGVGPGDRVGLCLGRTAEMAVALLAIVRTGAAYVPLDPSYPESRLALMVEVSGVGAVLVDGEAATALPASLAPELPRLAVGGGEVPPGPASPLPPAESLPGGDALAAVFFTSGSSGPPKGVGVPHRGIARLALGLRDYGIGADDCVAVTSSISFDGASEEIWGPLCLGGAMAIIPRDVLLDLAELDRATAEWGVSVFYATTALFHQLAHHRPEMLRRFRFVGFGGEAADPGVVARALEVLGEDGDRRLANLYGPTENATTSTAYRIPARFPGDRPVPIGRPIPASSARVFDALGRPTPLGTVGHLHLGGAGLARGYLGRPAATAEVFLPAPTGEPGSRLYATGDLVRRRPDTGELVFVGRIDDQAKIRGFRVEPGEVETVLAGLAGIAGAVAMVREDQPGSLQLVAYAVPEPGEAPRVDGLLAALGERLPAHLVPAHLVLLDELPTTPAGKVDRRALPAPAPTAAAAASGPAVAAAQHRRLRPVEALVAAVFAEVLGLEDVSADASFFQLGGHSLTAIQLSHRLAEVLGVELPVARVFEHPTVEALAAVLGQAVGSSGPGTPEPATRSQEPAVAPTAPDSDSGTYPLSFAQERFWFVDQMAGGVAVNNIPGAYRLSGPILLAPLARALARLAQRQEILRTAFELTPEGEPVQVVNPPPAPRLPVVDLGGLGEEQRLRELPRLVSAFSTRAFDLTRSPLWRWAVARLAAEEHAVLLCFHHAISDGWSIGLTLREMVALYRAEATGGDPGLPELSFQYGDHARRERERLAGAERVRLVSWWREQLDGHDRVIDLGRVRPERPGRRGVGLQRNVSTEVGRRWAELLASTRVSEYQAVMAAYQVVLGELGRSERFVVGVPVAGRDRPELAPLIGCFINTVPVAADLSGAPSFEELLARVRTAVVGATVHQELPLDLLVEELGVARDPRVDPLVQVMFTSGQLPTDPREAPGELAVTYLDTGRTTTQMDLNLTHVGMAPGQTSFGLYLEARRSLFDQAGVAALLDDLVAVIAAVAETPTLTVPELWASIERRREERAAEAGSGLKGRLEAKLGASRGRRSSRPARRPVRRRTPESDGEEPTS